MWDFCCCLLTDSAESVGLDDDEFVDKQQITRVFSIKAYGESRQHPFKLVLCGPCKNADAFLIAPTILGVADGVSSVEQEGYDPSRLPRELLRNCQNLSETRIKNPAVFDSSSLHLFRSEGLPFDEHEFPRHLLSRACGDCDELGSTTCCLALLEGRRLFSANIGDSALYILRWTAAPPVRLKDVDRCSDTASTCTGASTLPSPRAQQTCRQRIGNINALGGYRVWYKSSTQQHYFNCPYQITRMPDLSCSFYDILRRSSQAASCDIIDIQSGDLIIMGTDGMFDNLFDEELIDAANEICWKTAASNSHRLPMVAPQLLVDRLLRDAIEAAVPRMHEGCEMGITPRPTPFSIAAEMELGKPMQGGKPDDTTVVVGFVVPLEDRVTGPKASEISRPPSTAASDEPLLTALPLPGPFLSGEAVEGEGTLPSFSDPRLKDSRHE